jgi:hypothetical protein
MVYLLKIVIFHGYVSHNQMVYGFKENTSKFMGESWDNNGSGVIKHGKCKSFTRIMAFSIAMFEYQSSTIKQKDFTIQNCEELGFNWLKNRDLTLLNHPKV